VYQFVGAFGKIAKKRLLASLCLSVRMEQIGSTKRIFMKFRIWVFFDNLPRKFKFHLNRKRIKCTLHKDQLTFFIISPSILLRMRNVSDKSCRENRDIHFMFNNFFRKSCLFYIMRKMLQSGAGHTCQYGTCAHCITKATHTLTIFNTLKTKRIRLYLKAQSVPRCKHFSSQLLKPISLWWTWHKSLFVLR